MRHLISKIVIIFCIGLPLNASALISMELTRGVAGAIPIAVVPFAIENDENATDVSVYLSNDLQNSGRFKVYNKSTLSQLPTSLQQVSTSYFRNLGTDNVVIGKVRLLSHDKYEVSFQLLDMFRGKGEASVVLAKKYTVSASEFRVIGHHISDLIYQQLTGVRGIFSTKIAYVVVQRDANTKPRYLLEISDQDGFNPKPLLNSPEPIMSPAWSPNGKQVAYVSFEKKQASIYIQDVATGARRLVSQYPGINNAPAWSPDGRKLAIVLSKSGSPNIYILDIASGRLTPVTKDYYINTEPAFAKDGKSLLFTSNRSGGPQIYQVRVSDNGAEGTVSRISYDGSYNARPSFTSDGKHIAMIHRVSSVYNIAILDLDTSTMQVLTGSSADSTSPSIAPNGSMVLYDTVVSGRNVLAMVSSDGKVQLILPARIGDAQDPAWSPFLG